VAQQVAAQLHERLDCRDAAFPFVTSGNIDRYQVTTGNVRYMKRTFLDPALPQACSLLTPVKRRMFAGPKIVFAGMSRQLEAAYHPGNLALGVQVFAAADWQVDPYYLLALLNSRLLSHLFRTRFSAKRLAGGYLSVNKGQLAQLPIADPRAVGRQQQRSCGRIAALGKWLTANGSDEAAEAEIDRLVEQLYALSVDERALLAASVCAASVAA
jgi:adenine-specific DNA-methyltransferase